MPDPAWRTGGRGRRGGIRGWGGEFAQPPSKRQAPFLVAACLWVFSVLHCLAFLGNFELRDVAVCCFLRTCVSRVQSLDPCLGLSSPKSIRSIISTITGGPVRVPLHLQRQGCLSHFAPLTLRGTLCWCQLKSASCRSSTAEGLARWRSSTRLRLVSSFRF